LGGAEAGEGERGWGEGGRNEGAAGGGGAGERGVSGCGGGGEGGWESVLCGCVCVSEGGDEGEEEEGDACMLQQDISFLLHQKFYSERCLPWDAYVFVEGDSEADSWVLQCRQVPNASSGRKAPPPRSELSQQQSRA
jgi:hypothetical protein